MPERSEYGEAAVVNEEDARATCAQSVTRVDIQNVRIEKVERARQLALSCISIVL